MPPASLPKHRPACSGPSGGRRAEQRRLRALGGLSAFRAGRRHGQRAGHRRGQPGHPRIFRDRAAARGPGSFVEYAPDHDAFEAAMRRKLERELGVHGPGRAGPADRATSPLTPIKLNAARSLIWPEHSRRRLPQPRRGRRTAPAAPPDPRAALGQQLSVIIGARRRAAPMISTPMPRPGALRAGPGGIWAISSRCRSAGRRWCWSLPEAAATAGMAAPGRTARGQQQDSPGLTAPPMRGKPRPIAIDRLCCRRTDLVQRMVPL